MREPGAAEDRSEILQPLLEAALESTADGILIVDNEGGTIYANRRFAEMWRIPQSLLATRSDARLLAFVLDQLQDPGAFLAKVQELYQTSREAFDTLAFKDGRVFERYSRPLVQGGELAGRVWSFRDVTERELADRALRQALEGEREASRQLRVVDEMKTTFLNAVSHELRAPLTAIMGTALTLEEAGEALSEEDASHLVSRLASNARKLDRLLSDLLDLDRLSRGIVEPKRRPTDVGSLVRHLIEGSEYLAGRAIEVEASPVIASIDPAQVERIVENLMANTDRYTTRHTPVWISVRPEASGVLIEVADAGPGVPAELREAIFEPHRQGYPESSDHPIGFGIGLSLVARFAELHGGRAWLEEREGGGSSFRVYLPGRAGD
jgi:signal transduction histidine kinase